MYLLCTRYMTKRLALHSFYRQIVRLVLNFRIIEKDRPRIMRIFFEENFHVVAFVFLSNAKNMQRCDVAV